MHANAIVENSVHINPALFLADHRERAISAIRQKKNELHDSKHVFHKFHLVMRELERMLLRSEDESESLDEAVMYLKQQELTELNNLYCEWETQLERCFVNFLDLNIVGHFIDYPLYSRFERLINREVGLLGHPPRKMLFIGSGPMPITALCLRHRLPDTEIHCLERFESAVQESRVVMNKLGFNDSITVHHGFGEKIDVSEYDAILVALLAKPKRAILENLVRTMRNDAQLICRTSFGSRAVFYEPTLDTAVPPELEVQRVARAGIDDTISSVLLRKALVS